MGDLVASLAEALGPERVVSDPAELLVYDSDGSPLHAARPSAVVYPTTTEEVSAVVAACAAHGAPFVARGAGTGLAGGAMALDGGVVVALNRMDKLVHIDVANRRARVQPGLANLALSRAVAPHGLFYAPDPSSQAVCTLGGNVAHNSGGPHTLAYGVTVDHVLALELVLADGRVVRLGDPEGRQRPGLDLVALVVGSEGTLGIVSEITVRLLPLPAAVRTLLAAFATADAASRAVAEVIATGSVPAALEMLDDVVVEALAAAFGLRFPEGAHALLLLEVDGPAEGIEEEAGALRDVCLRCGALEVRMARDEQERAELWRARKRAFGALGRITRNYATQDGVIPRTRLPEMLRRVADIAARHRLRIANVFHAGDGNLHPCVLFDDRDADERARTLAAGREILAACLELGGSLSGEHGIGVDKRESMALAFDAPSLAAMARLRAAFDPSGRCNPKKILPLGGAGCAELPPSRRQIVA